MAADIEELKAAVRQWAFDVHTIGVQLMVDPVRGYAPEDKGELRQSIQIDPANVNSGFDHFGSDRFDMRLIAPVIQAKTTDQGSPPHKIRPKRIGGVLVFVAKSGETVFAREVDHPGNPARPWWERALRATFGPSLRYATLRVPFRSAR